MKTWICIVPLLSILLAAPPSAGYSILSHEEIIDIVWASDIRPALLKRFPAATPKELAEAHAYAYGGSVIQDLGYYPLGNHEFTDLLHYARTGDFLANMLREARSLNEFAFALGALSHYVGDVWGHPAVNRGVPVEYPRLRRKYGPLVTYEEDPEAHLKTEFSYDVVQVAKRRFISKQYHDFIGFEVSQALLERAFQDTYGLPLSDFLRYYEMTIGTYRFGASRVIPEMTQVALATREPRILKEHPDLARREFLYHLSRADYERDFGAKYRRPGIFARSIAFILRIIPKFGSFRALKYRDPSPGIEDAYFRSMDECVLQYHRLIERVNAGDPVFPNRNLDTGALTHIGEYRLADETYSGWVRRLARKHFAGLTPDLKASLQSFFAGGPLDCTDHKNKCGATKTALAAINQFTP